MAKGKGGGDWVKVGRGGEMGTSLTVSTLKITKIKKK